MGVCCGGLQATYKNKHYLFVHKTSVSAIFAHFLMLCPCFNSVSKHVPYVLVFCVNKKSTIIQSVNAAV